MPLGTISLRRSIWSYARVQRFLSRLIRNRRFQLKWSKGGGKQYVNIGCGPFPLEGFCNIDYWWQPGTHCFDISKGIPLPDDSASGIFSEHCLEYLKPESCLAVLRDFVRILRPGGVARIVLPDGGLYCQLYIRAMHGEAVSWPYPESGKPPIYYVNRIMSGYAHYTGFVYDFDAFKDMMLAAGFREVTRGEYRQGRDSNLLVDREVRAVESFYVEGIS